MLNNQESQRPQVPLPIGSKSVAKSARMELVILNSGGAGDPGSFFNEEFARHVEEGLSRPCKAISSRYFYDARGSEIFAQITDLDEYYLTRCELENLNNFSSKIISNHILSGHPAAETPVFNLIELGAGDGRKTQVLIEAIQNKGLEFEYFPVDISKKAITDLFERLGSTFQGQRSKCTGVLGDYFDALEYIRKEKPPRKNVVLFLGSSIGNFTGEEARNFFRVLRHKLLPRDILLIGFDLKKDPKVLYKAYSDSKGISREFNLNLLDRMNRELGADFDRDKFEHRPRYNAAIGAMESTLVSTVDQVVTFTGLSSSGKKRFRFDEHESLFTEYSFKYCYEDIQSMAEDTGFAFCDAYYDSNRWFLDAVWTLEQY